MPGLKRDHLKGSGLLALGAGGLVTLLGFVVLGWLLAEPSDRGGFLGFTASRWGLIVFQGLSAGAFGLLTFRIWRSASPLSRFGSWLQGNDRNLFALLLPLAVLFIAGLVILCGGIPTLASAGFFPRLRPTLVWLTLSSAAALLFLFVHSRDAFVAGIRRFFPPPGSHEAVLPPLLPSQRWWLFGIAILYLIMQGRGHIAVGEARWLPDSIDYIFPSSFGWTDPVLWTHTKPWGAAVLYKITGPSPRVIDMVQTGLSALAWLGLAVVFVRGLRRAWVRVVAFGLLLALSLTRPVAMWNHIIQSESLSISSMVLILALWLALLQSWSWMKFTGLIPLFGLWAGSRETNVYLCLLIAAALIPIGIIWARHRAYWLLSVCLLSFAWLNLRISEMPTIPRWAYPLANVILERVLPDPEFLKYFEDRGMPARPELLALSGQPALANDFAVFNDRALNEFETWLFRDGRQTYVDFLAAHPGYTARAPLLDFRTLLGSREIADYPPSGFQPAFPVIMNEVLFLGSWLWLVLLVASSILVLRWRARLWRDSPAFWLLSGFFLLTIPHLYVVWHGDSSEIARHAVQASIQLRLSLWLLVMYSLDRITIGVSDRSS